MEKTQPTSPGFNWPTYIEDKKNGRVAIDKPIKTSGNYRITIINFDLRMVGSQPVATELPPTYANLNKGNIDELNAQIAASQASIDHARAQVEAIVSDMEAADLA